MSPPLHPPDSPTVGLSSSLRRPAPLTLLTHLTAGLHLSPLTLSPPPLTLLTHLSAGLHLSPLTLSPHRRPAPLTSDSLSSHL